MTGLRTWCKHRGVDFKKLLRQGLDAEELRKLDDAMVNSAIAKAEEEDRGR